MAAKLDVEKNLSPVPEQVVIPQDARDSYGLSRMGKKPVLKRNFGFMPLLGFSCTCLITWEGLLLTWQTAYQEGGSAGSIYTYLIVWFGMFCTYLTIAELASMAPTSAGQYHWVSMLAPSSCQNFLSYITSWICITGWQAGCASAAFNSGMLIQGLITLCNPTYTPANWRTTLLAWAVLAFAVFINTIASTALSKFEGLILVLHIIGFLAVLIPLLYLAPHNSSHDVWAVFMNYGGWETQGYAFFIGLVGPVYAFVGADAAVHMAEEIKNAAVVIPRALIMTMGINGSLGFAMLLAILYCLGDPSEVPEAILETSFGFPFVQVFVNGVQSVAGAAIMTSIILVLGVSSAVGLLATSSRMFWSFARDRGLPMWQVLSKVNSRTSIPVAAVVTTTTIAALLAMIGIGSSVAFNDIISITVVGLYGSYFISASLLLWRRMTGAIRNPTEFDPSESMLIVNTKNAALMWGPFRMPRVIGELVNGFACVYLFVVFLFAFWPPAKPVTPATMNFACLVFGATVLFSAFWYLVYAKKVYKGPVVDI